MKKKTQRIIVIILAVVMLLSILIPALSVIAEASISQSDIDQMKGQLSSITALKNQALKELNAIRGDQSKAEDQIELVRGQIIMTEQEISISQQMLDHYTGEIAGKEAEIASLEQQEADQYDQFCQHVRWLEETGSVSYLSVLFRASSFAELLDYATLIADIMDYSNEIITDLELTQAEVEEAKEELEAAKAGQAEAHAILETHLADLAVKEAEAQALYDELSASAAEAAAEAQKLTNDEAAMKAEVTAAEKKFAAQIAALQSNGEWQWPLPGWYGISSVFGGRYSPINGRWESHTGTDIPAYGGTKILAAQDGVVTTVGTNRYHSYGYYVMITHANGRATLYAHMQKVPSVKVGQTVKKGQVIGYVGTTGSSTGNHLHFELRVNGVRSDVLMLYPNLPYTGMYVNIIKERLNKK